MKLSKIIIALMICLAFLPCCNNSEFTKCLSTELVMGDNYTIEIVDGGEYTGIYHVTSDTIERITATNTYYYFSGDSNRYFKVINDYNSAEDNNAIYNTLSMIKSIFTGSKYLYKNADGSIFKTKTGNMIYAIGTTEINYKQFDKNIQNIEVKNLKSGDSYIITNSAVKVKTNSDFIYYLVTSSGLKKYAFNGASWQNDTCEYGDIYKLRDSILADVGDRFVQSDNYYLSDRGVSLREYKEPLPSTFPSLANNNYTFRVLASDEIYSVTNSFVKVTVGDVFTVYTNGHNRVIELTNNNFNNHITQSVSSDYNTLSEIVSQFKNDFAISYSNDSKTSYIVVGDNGVYELAKINRTVVASVSADAEYVEDIKPLLYGHNFTLKDTKYNFDYVFAGTVFEIVNNNLMTREYYSYENEKIYHIKSVNGEWQKTVTEFSSVYDAFDFDSMCNDMINDGILKITDKKGDYDFESRYYKILGYDQYNSIDLPA